MKLAALILIVLCGCAVQKPAAGSQESAVRRVPDESDRAPKSFTSLAEVTAMYLRIAPGLIPNRAPIQSRQSAAEPAVVAPPTILHVGFADQDNNWVTDTDWTNSWQFSVLVCFDPSAPRENWQELFPTLETYAGLLTFALAANGPQSFCLGKFQPRPDAP